MKFRSFINSGKGAAASVAALAIVGGGLAIAMNTGGASAATQVTYTGAGANSTAGWSAFSPDLVTFSHIETLMGSSGKGSWENLPLTPGLATSGPGDNITDQVNGGDIKGGAGLQMCDRNTGHKGEDAQIGLVQVTPGWFDLVEAVGFFGNHALNSSGDVCDNGLLGEAAGSGAYHAVVLLTGIHVNDTVKVGILYDPFHSFFFGGTQFPVGTITFYGTDQSNVNNTNTDSTLAADWFASPFDTNEADAGVVSDTVQSPALNLSIPAPNGGVLAHQGLSELIRFAHVKVNANNAINGKGEVQGSFQSNADWNTYPVAATTDGAATGLLYLDPSQFKADNFYVAGGLGLVLQGSHAQHKGSVRLAS